MRTKKFTLEELKAIDSLIQGNTHIHYWKAINDSECNSVDFYTAKLLDTYKTKNVLIIIFEKLDVAYDTPSLKLMVRYDTYHKNVQTQHEKNKIYEYIKNNESIRYKARQIHVAMFDTKKKKFITSAGSGMFEDAIYEAEITEYTEGDGISKRRNYK